MTVPGRVDAAALLLSLDPPPWFLRHSQAVAEIASWLAARTEVAGAIVDRRLVEAAALLHDVDKILPPSDRARRLPHGEGSSQWLARQGHPELGRAVANHPVTRLADGDAFGRWATSATREERIVAYADKRAGQRLQPMDERFASWARRHPEGPRPDGPADDGAAWTGELASKVRARAAQLEADVCRAADIAPGDVARVPWTGPALRAARRGGRKVRA